MTEAVKMWAIKNCQGKMLFSSLGATEAGVWKKFCGMPYATEYAVTNCYTCVPVEVREIDPATLNKE